MTRAETLFLACCDVLAHHRGSAADPIIRAHVEALAEVLPEISEPGPGPEIAGTTLRSIAERMVSGGPLCLPEVQHFLRMLLEDDAIGRARAAYEAWGAEIVSEEPIPAA